MPNVKANITNINRNAGGMGTVEFIVVHNTANGTSAEGTAYNNTCYFKDTYREASAHYFIDDGQTVWQCVPETDIAWHCGDSSSRNGAYNSNAIGIEVCEPSWGEFTENERETLRWLVLDLMARYGVGADHVVRHFDVTGKRCPWLYADNQDMWEELHGYITGEDDMDKNTLMADKSQLIMGGTTYPTLGNLTYWTEKNTEQILGKLDNIKVELDYDKLASKVASKVAGDIATAVADKLAKRLAE